MIKILGKSIATTQASLCLMLAHYVNNRSVVITAAYPQKPRHNALVSLRERNEQGKLEYFKIDCG
jgi:hypothetical protein